MGCLCIIPGALVFCFQALFFFPLIVVWGFQRGKIIILAGCRGVVDRAFCSVDLNEQACFGQ